MFNRMKKHLPIIGLIVFAAALQASMAAGVVAVADPPSGFLPPDPAWVRRQMRKLSLRDKVAQLVQIRINGRYYHQRNPEYIKLLQLVSEQHVGGACLFAGNVYESAILINQLQRVAPLPLLIASDFENGAAFRIADAASFPGMMAVGAAGSEVFSREIGQITALEARALGVHWVYAPVMDVNNNPDNPVINTRSFGEDPLLVARLGVAFIKGCRERGVMTTAKHFPGHGDTSMDSHVGLPVITADFARLKSLELIPFQAAIEAGTDAIMTAHLAVPALTGDPQLPATFSPQILHGLLEEQLHFKGLVVTDALEMGGITLHHSTGEAAVKALQAGTDLLVLPPDPVTAIDAVVNAVRSGEIPLERINRSVSKLLLAKTRLGLSHQRLVPIAKVNQVLSSPESKELSRKITEHSLTLVKDEKNLIPMKPAAGSQVATLIVTDNTENHPLPAFQTEIRRHFPGAPTLIADARFCAGQDSVLLASLESAQTIFLATQVRTVSGRGSIGLAPNLRDLLDKVVKLNKDVIWVSFGNPYLLSLFPQVSSYLCTYSTTETAQSASVKALIGELEITGKLPVSIPGCAAVGTGITRSSSGR
jgi:beta-N-acetylhexosaminidase